MIYDFKKGARIPVGVTADGVMEERDRIAEEYGKASIRVSTNAVMSEPDKFPNLRAFAPDDPEEALKLCIEDGVRYAYATIVPFRVKEATNGGTRDVRVLFPVPDDDGELVYERIEVIKESAEKRKYLLDTLAKQARDLSNKLEDVIAELGIAA